MKPWYRVVMPRKEVCEGRSFNPDEFAIALEQVVAGTAPEDYRDPAQFFSRTCWTRALREHAGMVLRRLAGTTQNTAPVLTLITQFGGGKTHTLTALYHLATRGSEARHYSGVSELLRENRLSAVPQARVGVFVGSAWDPQPERETPWIDLARQLAGERGVEALGAAAGATPPGTEAIGRVFQAANAPVLLLFDEVLNFLNRHRSMAEAFHAFIQNLTVAATATRCGAVVISLPRSQVEMTDWDYQWQEKITRVVRRVARDLIVNDETEISEVVRRRLFEHLGDERLRKRVAQKFADWCFERRAQLPPEWTAVDTDMKEARAREFLRRRFEACYPFHPATLSVFHRKWQALPQYQQTRSTLAMLAQWIALARRDSFRLARQEPLITLGSAPLEDRGFCSTVLGQLGDSRLVAAIDTDIAGESSHARALDRDTKDRLCDIHRRVGTAILFESSGGQRDRVAHLPELRFALGDPDGVDTTSIDNAAFALENRCYYIRRVGSDGFRIGPQPTLRKIVNDRRASLDEETEILPEMRRLVEREFRHRAAIRVALFSGDGADVPDSPQLSLVVVDPLLEWNGNEELRGQLAEWIRQRGHSPRLYPAALVWCFKKPGRELREKVELWLAWKRVAQEFDSGVLGSDFDNADRVELHTRVREAENAAREEVWGGYRFVVLADDEEPDGLKTIDLGAGHSSNSEPLCGRVIAALKSAALLNETIGASYLERKWPPALRDSGEWPLAGLRQSFLNGKLTRLLDPERVLREKIVEFVARGEFGLASGRRADGTYERFWFREQVPPDEVVFDSEVFLLTKARAEALHGAAPMAPPAILAPAGSSHALAPARPSGDAPATDPMPYSTNAAGTVGLANGTGTQTLRLHGEVRPDAWNRIGTRIVTKLRTGEDFRIRLDFSVRLTPEAAGAMMRELSQILEELDPEHSLQFEVD